MKKKLTILLLVCAFALGGGMVGAQKQRAPERVKSSLPTADERKKSIDCKGPAGARDCTQVQQDVDSPGYERGVLIVKFTPQVAESLLLSLSGKARPTKPTAWPPFLRSVAQKYRLNSIEPLFNPALVSPARINQMRRRFSQRTLRAKHTKQAPRLDDIFKLKFDRQADLERAAKELSALPQVVFAEPNRLYKIFYTPNDPYYNSNDLWGLFNVNAATAWDTAKGLGVTVAVIDTGVDISHYDLQPNIWINAGEIPNDGIDNDNNGFIDDRNGWDFAYGDNQPSDFNGHGTHVAGTIGAVGNNLHGVVGLAFQSKIMPVKGLDDGGAGFISNLANAIHYATDNGADVINNSWGGADSPLIRTTVDWAHSMGVVVVSAAGNSNAEACNFSPANAENSLTVSSFKRNDTRSSFSNFGVKVDVAAPGGLGAGASSAAPGTDILSTSPPTAYLAASGFPVITDTNAYKYMPLYGTSMAAPHVSALAALLIESHPVWTNEETRQAIRLSADDVSTTGFDTDSGYGRINAANAVVSGPTPPTTALVREPHNCKLITGSEPVNGLSDVPSGNGSYTVDVGPGDVPPSFAPIGNGSTPISGGTLATFNSLNFPDGRQTIRVTTTDISSGKTSEDRNVVNVNNVFIASPSDTQLISSSTFPVTGMADGNLGFVDYKLEWAAGCNATSGFNLITTSTTPVNPTGPLGNWNLSSVPDGPLTLRLTATFSGNGGFISQDQKCVLLDRLIAPGWPVPVNQVPAFKSPKIADLDGDGTNEIVLGGSVFEPDGSVRAGWSNFPGLGRSNPAILDIDGTPNTLEVVAAVFDGTLTSPNYGAPVIYAYKHDKSVLWSYIVQNPNTTVTNANYGIMSSISAGDVDGDGQPEIVFSIYFRYNNTNPLKTRIFVLDAATGTLQNSFTVNGQSQSSVALADVDENGVPDLVIESWIQTSNDGLISVLNGSGAPLPGWPVQIPSAADTQGFGDIDPVLADVDGDGHLEILVGRHLLNYDGTPQLPGWPFFMWSRSTGVMVPLPDGDCQMEVVMSSANTVAFIVAEHDAQLIYMKSLSFGENAQVIMGGENGLQGNPVVADVDGDQQVEIVRPGELIVSPSNHFMPIYASEALNSAWPSGYPRFVLNPNPAGWVDPIRSTAAIGDVDKDGNVDMVIAAAGQLYLWNLNKPYTQSLSYWPMFQRDLRNTGTIPAIRLGDLYLQDSPVDVGNEPNNDSSPGDVWSSPDIWNCQNAPTCTQHQNPEYKQFGDNYMRVTIRNRSCAASQPATLRLYWSRARTSETWNTDWVNSGGGTTAQPLGNEVTPGSGLTIPSLPPGGTITLTQAWQPPDPAWNGYQLTAMDWQGYPMVCLLARIESASDPMFNEAFGPIAPNVINNNNIVTRNTYVTNLFPNKLVSDDVSVMVHNATRVRSDLSLDFTPAVPSPRRPFQSYGTIKLTLDDALWRSWAAGGFKGRGFKLSGRKGIIQITDPRGARLESISFKPGESGQVAVQFKLSGKSLATEDGDFKFFLTQSSERRRVDGSVAFEISLKPNREIKMRGETKN
ncbi:MAG: S8 family serine peptidase [Pyrinomonadaceae bacterium]